MKKTILSRLRHHYFLHHRHHRNLHLRRNYLHHPFSITKDFGFSLLHPPQFQVMNGRKYGLIYKIFYENII